MVIGLLMSGLLVIAAVIAVTLIFNRVIGKRNHVKSARALIDAQLKKRHDLIPILIAVCEKHLGYEAAVLMDLTMIRTKAIGAVSDRSDVHGQLESQLRIVFAATEPYPALRDTDDFVRLQRSLAEIEERLAAAREIYDASAAAYEQACQMPLTGIAARILGYRSATLSERGGATIAH
jgi:LemA protein